MRILWKMVDLSEGTKFVVMRRCLNCWEISESGNKRCRQCNYLFTGEATDEQNQKGMEKIIKLKELAEEKDEDT